MREKSEASRPTAATVARSATPARALERAWPLALHTQRRFASLATFLLLLAAPWPAAQATTLNVPEVYSTIQAAVDAAATLDTILVGPGTYFENIDLHSKWLTLLGVAGPAATVLDGNRRGTVLIVAGGGIVEGFTIRGGQAQFGGGVKITGPAQAVLRRNTIVDNVSGDFVDSGLGGGVYLDLHTRSVLIEENEIRDNYAGSQGGGIYDASTLEFGNEIRKNVIAGNGCHVCGGGVRLGLAALVDNLVLGNWSDSFGGGVCGAGQETRGNTIVRNFTNNNFWGGGAGIHANSGLAILNNIVVGNHGLSGASAGVGIVCISDGLPLRIECNDSWGNDGGDYRFVGDCDTSGGGNISADPSFCDEVKPDFRLRPGSPCAPDGATGCGLIGAFPVGMGCALTPGVRRSWGQVKVLYR